MMHRDQIFCLPNCIWFDRVYLVGNTAYESITYSTKTGVLHAIGIHILVPLRQRTDEKQSNDYDTLFGRFRRHM